MSSPSPTPSPPAPTGDNPPSPSSPSSPPPSFPDFSFWKQCQRAFSGYITEIGEVRSLDDWLSLNQKQFGSSSLQLDKFGTGAAFGFVSGYAMRQALCVTAFMCGVGFMSLQTLNYYGYINVNWRRLEQDLQAKLDLNQDGRVDREDVHLLRKKLLTALTWGLPSAAGFGTGFVMGIRKW